VSGLERLRGTSRAAGVRAQRDVRGARKWAGRYGFEW